MPSNRELLIALNELNRAHAYGLKEKLFPGFFPAKDLEQVFAFHQHKFRRALRAGDALNFHELWELVHQAGHVPDQSGDESQTDHRLRACLIAARLWNLATESPRAHGKDALFEEPDSQGVRVVEGDCTVHARDLPEITGQLVITGDLHLKTADLILPGSLVVGGRLTVAGPVLCEGALLVGGELQASTIFLEKALFFALGFVRARALVETGSRGEYWWGRVRNSLRDSQVWDAPVYKRRRLQLFRRRLKFSEEESSLGFYKANRIIAALHTADPDCKEPLTAAQVIAALKAETSETVSFGDLFRAETIWYTSRENPERERREGDSQLRDFPERLDTMLTELQENPEILLMADFRFPPAPEAVFGEIEERLEFTLDEAVKNFYRFTNGIQIRWIAKSCAQYAPREHFVQDEPMHWRRAFENYHADNGSMIIPPIEQVFLEPVYSELYDHAREYFLEYKGRKYNEYAFRERLRFFDLHSIRGTAALFLDDQYVIWTSEDGSELHFYEALPFADYMNRRVNACLLVHQEEPGLRTNIPVYDPCLVLH